MNNLNTTVIHESWRELVNHALRQLDPDYLRELDSTDNWLPGPQHIFNAFSLPLSQTHYILFGESPYPRAQSANGYAFWDAAVEHLWVDNGLSKPVNRATSLRNLIKMLLVTRGSLSIADTSQPAIAAVDKQGFVQELPSLFTNFLNQGFLLLNTSLVLSQRSVRAEAKLWLPFIRSLLSQLQNEKNRIRFILFGQVAKEIDRLNESNSFDCFYAEHPYNISFIANSKVQAFFKPLDLLAIPRSAHNNRVE